MGFVAIGDKKVADTTPDLTPYALAQDVEEAFENVVSVEDIAKEITSESTDDEVASAKAVFDELADKADKNYGAENKGKMLVVGEDGEITPDEPTLSTVAMTKNAWQIYDKSKLKDGQEVIITDDDSAEGVIDDSEPRGDATYSSQKITESLEDLDNKITTSIKLTDATTSDAKTVIERKWSSLENGKTYNAVIETSGNTWQAVIYKHLETHGVVELYVYNTGLPSYIGKNYGGVWTWQELATMDKVFVTDNLRTRRFGGNIDDIDVANEYNVDANNCSGVKPYGDGWFFLKTYIHALNSAYRTQVAYNMTSTDTTMVKIRRRDGGSWGSWVALT